MSILNELASQLGERSSTANHLVAGRCLVEPQLLAEIVPGLQAKDARLVGDCAEVLTEVARQNPALVAPFAGELVRPLAHKNGRVRWEATHCLALVAALAPETIRSLLPELQRMIAVDESVIVRDYAIDAVANFAGVDRETALAAYPLLQAALAVWDGRHAGHALDGLAQVARQMPELHGALAVIGRQYADHPKAVIRQAARRLLRAMA